MDSGSLIDHMSPHGRRQRLFERALDMASTCRLEALGERFGPVRAELLRPQLHVDGVAWLLVVRVHDDVVVASAEVVLFVERPERKVVLCVQRLRNVHVPSDGSHKVALERVNGGERELREHDAELDVPAGAVLPDLGGQKHGAEEDGPPRGSEEGDVGLFHQSFDVNQADDAALRTEVRAHEERREERVDVAHRRHGVRLLHLVHREREAAPDQGHAHTGVRVLR
mmetsp:Transcript_7205/g.23477  ORF Transcript_7205/g.23477 Transcript_7205/m.23477 type:complete len:226 (+) Transcript_7205:139-816(+)